MSFMRVFTAHVQVAARKSTVFVLKVECPVTKDAFVKTARTIIELKPR